MGILKPYFFFCLFSINLITVDGHNQHNVVFHENNIIAVPKHCCKEFEYNILLNVLRTRCCLLFRSLLLLLFSSPCRCQFVYTVDTGYLYTQNKSSYK